MESETGGLNRTADETEVPALRPRKDAARNRVKILEAADAMVAERGLELSFNDIAHLAGVGVGTVYRHFSSKQALLEALISRRFEEIEKVLAETEDLEPVEALRQTVLRIGELQRDQGVTQMMMAVSGHTHEATQQAFQQAFQPTLARIMERAKATGHVREDIEVTDLPVLFWMSGQLARFTEDARPDLWSRYIEMMLDAVVPPKSAEPTPVAAPTITELQHFQPSRRNVVKAPLARGAAVHTAL